MLSWLAFLAAPLFNPDRIWHVAIQAILLSLHEIMFLIWPVWSLLCAWKMRKKTILFLSMFTPWWFGAPEQSYTSQDAFDDELDLVVVNVNAYTGKSSDLERFLSELKSEALIMIEKRAEQIEGMTRVVDDFKREYVKPSHHTALWCTEQCQGFITQEYGSESLKMPILLAKHQKGICIIAVHAPPQVPIDASGMQSYIDVLVQHINNGRMSTDWGVCKKDDSVVVVGDLNAVPYSLPYKRLVEQGLTDVRLRAGALGMTWPNGGGFIPVPLFRLDHILVGSEVEVRFPHSFSVPNSDHRGLRVLLRSASKVQ